MVPGSDVGKGIVYRRLTSHRATEPFPRRSLALSKSTVETSGGIALTNMMRIHDRLEIT
jgi:hypothetical protein